VILCGAIFFLACIAPGGTIQTNPASGGQRVDPRHGKNSKIWLVAHPSNLFDKDKTTVFSVKDKDTGIYFDFTSKVKANGKRMYINIDPKSDISLDRKRLADSGLLTITLKTDTMMNMPPVTDVPVVYDDDTP